MRYDPLAIMEMLQRLERQGTMFRPCVAELAAAGSRGDFGTALEQSGTLHSVLESIVATRALLRDQVVHADGLGDPDGSLDELMIRARGVVVTMQVSRLRDALRDPAAKACCRDWLRGRFRGPEDVAAYLSDEVRRIHGLWRPYRGDQPQLPGVAELDRVVMYNTTLRIAQRAVRELGQVPEVVHFLRGGVAAVDLPDVHSACAHIATALSVDLGPSLSAPLHRTKRATSGAAGSR